jgi:hypothetical protein
MKSVTLAACLLIGVIGALPAAGEDTRMSEEGFVLIDGEPRLLIGSYHLPDDDAFLHRLADHGFNFVRGKPDDAVLDRIAAAGMYAWIPLGHSLALGEDDSEKQARLREVIEQYKGHPALISWEGPDEALWLQWYNGFRWNIFEQPMQLLSLIQKTAQDKEDNVVAEWKTKHAKAGDLIARGLWAEGQALYDELWQALGEENPHPEQSIAACIARAAELGEELTRGWRFVRGIDPDNVFWQNHAPRNTIEALQRYNREVDAAGCDIYPMPFNRGVLHSDLPDRSLSCIGAYTERMQAAAPGKAVWMVLQGFGWKDLDDPFNPKDEVGGRRPTYEESRFMAYDAIVHGAQAVLYWGTHVLEPEDQLWTDLLKISRELRALEPGIVGKPPETAPVSVGDDTYASIGKEGPVLMLRKTGDDYVLIAVNESYVGIGFNVSRLPDELNGKILYRLYSEEAKLVQNNSFRDGIRGNDVHVYATSRRFEAKND